MSVNIFCTVYVPYRASLNSTKSEHDPQDDPHLDPSVKFCAAIVQSPHLLHLVHCLRIDITDTSLEVLSNYAFPKLRDVFLSGFSPSKQSLPACARLIGLPSVCRVGLISGHFDVQQFNLLFADREHRVDSLYLHDTFVSGRKHPAHEAARLPAQHTTTKYLELSADQGDGPTSGDPTKWLRRGEDPLKWLRQPSSPLDLTALETLDCRAHFNPRKHGTRDVAMALIADLRLTLNRLKIHAQHVMKKNPIIFRDLPALTHLTMVITDAAG
ncbi:hypothetical protein C8R43DRAFT_1134689 [Mycena crocata]|nr:hypothetical protein C8R43DRAFT_1134689 [Mycena crocata]